MAFVDETIANLVAQGFFDYVLPFLLVFFVVFAILEQTAILGKKGKDGVETNKGLDAAVALVIGLFMLYFARVFQVGRFLSFFTGKSSIVIILLVFAFMMTVFVLTVMKNNGMIPGEGKESQVWIYGLIIFAIVCVVIYYILQSSPNTWEMLFGATAGGQ